MKLKCAAVSLVLLLTALLGCETTPRRTYSTELQPHENAAELQAISTEVHRLVNAHRASLDGPELHRHRRGPHAGREIFFHPVIPPPEALIQAGRLIWLSNFR